MTSFCIICDYSKVRRSVLGPGVGMITPINFHPALKSSNSFCHLHIYSCRVRKLKWFSNFHCCFPFSFFWWTAEVRQFSMRDIPSYKLMCGLSIQAQICCRHQRQMASPQGTLKGFVLSWWCRIPIGNQYVFCSGQFCPYYAVCIAGVMATSSWGLGRQRRTVGGLTPASPCLVLPSCANRRLAKC